MNWLLVGFFVEHVLPVEESSIFIITSVANVEKKYSFNILVGCLTAGLRFAPSSLTQIAPLRQLLKLVERLVKYLIVIWDLRQNI